MKLVETAYPGIYKHPRSGVFYFRETVHSEDLTGQRVERSLKTDSIKEALHRAKLIRQKVMKGEQDQATIPRTFDDAFDSLLRIQSPTAKATLDQTKAIVDGHLRPYLMERCPGLKRFENEFEEVWADYKVKGSARKVPSYFLDENGDPLDDEQVAEWKTKNSTPRALKHDQRYLVMALKRAHNRGWVKRLFSKTDFPLSQVSEPIGIYIEDDQVEKILKAAKTQPKLHLQVLIALTMGMRISEILHLNKEEINLRKREIDLDPKRVKTRKRREVPVPISDVVFPLLDAAYKEAQGPFIFPAWRTSDPGKPVDWTKPQDDNRYYWNQVRSELDPIPRFHDLRHTCITNLLIAGVPDIAVRKICGVSEVTMRRIYAHIESKLKDRFRDAFKGRYS